MIGGRPVEVTMRCPHCGEAHPRDAKACPMTGRPMPGAFVPGQVLEGKYRIVLHIADGGMGAVYEAEHLALGKHVAVKTLHPDLSKNEDLVSRLQKEARAATAIGHEHIVDVHDLGRTHDGAVYIVMELLSGQNLAERLRSAGGMLSVPRAAHILKQVVAALAAAHKVGIVHRDLKPENIFLIQRRNDPDFVKVLDFGTAKLMDDTPDAKLESTGFVLGTPYYMAPEQARGGAVDHRVDIYACGAMLYHMVTGRVPFHAPNFNALMFEIAGGRYAPPRAIVPDIPAAFEQIIQWAMALDVGQRFQSAEQFVQALVPYSQVAAGPARPSNNTIPNSAVPTLVVSSEGHEPRRLNEAARGGAVPQDPDDEAQTTIHPENPYLKEEEPTVPLGGPKGLVALSQSMAPTAPGRIRQDPPTPGKVVPSSLVLPATGPGASAPGGGIVGHVMERQKTLPMTEGPIVGPGPVQGGPTPSPGHPAPGLGVTDPYARGNTLLAAPAGALAAPQVAPGPRPYGAPSGLTPLGQPALGAPALAVPRPWRDERSSSSSKSVIITIVVGVLVGLGLGGGIIWFVRVRRAGPGEREASSITVRHEGGLPIASHGGAEVTSLAPAAPPVAPPGEPPTPAPAPNSPSAAQSPAAPGTIRAVLTFEVSPHEAARDATIKVDGEDVNGTTATVAVKAGQKVRVQVKSSGFVGYDRRLPVSGDLTVDVPLRKRAAREREGPSGPGGSINL